MMYADFDYYQNSYFGVIIAEEDFPRYAAKASQYLDYITYGKAARNADLEALKMCCCALAENEKTIETAKQLSQKSLAAAATDGAEVQSESVGSWSRSFRSGGSSAQEAESAASELKKLRYETAAEYLAHTGLLYRGGGRCKCPCSPTP